MHVTALHHLQERNRRALEMLLQKDKAIQALQQQLQETAAAQAHAEAAAASAEAQADALRAALQEAGRTGSSAAAAAELAAVQHQQHAAAVAALQEQLASQGQQLAAASQQVLELSTQLARIQAQASSAAADGAAGVSADAHSADESSMSLNAGVGPTQAHQQQLQPSMPPGSTPDSAVADCSAAPPAAHADSSSSSGRLCSDPQHTELLSLLAERDASLAQLESQLAVTRAALGGRSELPGETGAVAQVGLGWRGRGGGWLRG
jgi:hypothetical protein